MKKKWASITLYIGGNKKIPSLIWDKTYFIGVFWLPYRLTINRTRTVFGIRFSSKVSDSEGPLCAEVASCQRSCPNPRPGLPSMTIINHGSPQMKNQKAEPNEGQSEAENQIKAKRKKTEWGAEDGKCEKLAKSRRQADFSSPQPNHSNYAFLYALSSLNWKHNLLNFCISRFKLRCIILNNFYSYFLCGFFCFTRLSSSFGNNFCFSYFYILSVNGLL